MKGSAYNPRNYVHPEARGKLKEHLNKQITMSAPWHRYKRIWFGVVVAAALGVVTLFAFSRSFTTFASYDDEGYFLQAYHDFLSGRIPYNQISSIYGPFTFCVAALTALFNVANVTHDAFRWALLPFWIAIAALIAGVVWRWTARFSASISAFLLAGFNLSGLASEVGHPQPLILLAIALLAWIGLDWLYHPPKWSRAFWTGFLAGIALLCKINIGIFVSVAIVFAVSLQLKGRLRLVASGASMIVAMGLGFFVLPTASRNSEKFFLFAYLGSLVTTAGFALFRLARNRPSLTSLRWLAAGFATCLVAVIGVTLAWGTTFRALFESLVTEPSHWKNAFHLRFIETRSSALCTLFGIGAAIAVFIWRRQIGVRAGWLGLFKMMVGSGLLLWIYLDPFSALTVSLAFLWLLIVDTHPVTDEEYSNRLLLVLLCPLFSLQILPVPGWQVTWASIMQIAASAVLLADGINCIEREGLQMRLPRLTRAFAQATGIAVAIIFFLFVGRGAIGQYRQWRASVPVDLPGTHWLRLSPVEKSRLTITVSELKQNCQTVLMVPGVYSFSLWSGVPAAEEKKLNTWPFLWPDEVQKNELPKLMRQPKACVLVAAEPYKTWKRMAISKNNDELLNEIQKTMRPIYTNQDITLYRSVESEPAPVSSPTEIDRP